MHQYFLYYFFVFKVRASNSVGNFELQIFSLGESAKMIKLVDDPLKK